jgi:hypothetical protein
MGLHTLLSSLSDNYLAQNYKYYFVFRQEGISISSRTFQYYLTFHAFFYLYIKN